jgi:hypothetical protein
MPDKRYGVTRAYVPVGVGSCPNQYHIKHDVTLTFRGPGNGWFKRGGTLEGSNIEKQDTQLVFTAYGYYGNPGNGNVNIDVTGSCVYHGVNRRGGPKWAPWNW